MFIFGEPLRRGSTWLEAVCSGGGTSGPSGGHGIDGLVQYGAIGGRKRRWEVRPSQQDARPMEPSPPIKLLRLL